jgi:hypothetical protein
MRSCRKRDLLRARATPSMYVCYQIAVDQQVVERHVTPWTPVVTNKRI